MDAVVFVVVVAAAVTFLYWKVPAVKSMIDKLIGKVSG